MDYNAMFKDISIAVITLITFILARLVQLATKYVKQIIEQAEHRKMLDLLEDAVKTAVVRTNQEIVDKLKEFSEDGSLTDQEKDEAFENTYDIVILIIGNEMYEELHKVIPDFEEWIKSKIEYYVNINKTKL